METLTNSPESFRHLLSSCQKVRSIASENGYLDLLGPHLGMPGLDPMVAHPKTVELLHDLSTGARTCDAQLWMNLTYIVEKSPTWSLELAGRGYQMPDRADLLGLTDAASTDS